MGKSRLDIDKAFYAVLPNTRLRREYTCINAAGSVYVRLSLPANAKAVKFFNFSIQAGTLAAARVFYLRMFADQTGALGFVKNRWTGTAGLPLSTNNSMGLPHGFVVSNVQVTPTKVGNWYDGQTMMEDEEFTINSSQIIVNETFKIYLSYYSHKNVPLTETLTNATGADYP